MKKKSIFIIFLLVVTLTAANSKLVDLVIEYPEEQVKGTELPKKVQNLEKPRAKGTAPKLLKVPNGCKNLAEEKDVTASDSDPSVGDLDYIVDADADGNEYIQIKDGLQWVQINLEESKKLYAVHLWHYYVEPRVYNDIVIQVSDDPKFVKNVTTVFNNDHDNSSGLGKGTHKNYVEEYYGKSISIDGVKGQYVRFYSNGNSADKSNNYIEIQVYGK